MTEPRYSWVVRNSYNEPWGLLDYGWTNRKDALNEAEHWLNCSWHGYAQVMTVERADDTWTPIEEPRYQEVYELPNGHWVWRHVCPQSGMRWRQYHWSEERADAQRRLHRPRCDSRMPFFRYADILMYQSPDHPTWIPV